MVQDTGEQHIGAKEVFCHASVIHSYSYSIWHGSRATHKGARGSWGDPPAKHLREVIQWWKAGALHMPLQDGTSAPVAVFRCINVGPTCSSQPG
jgi:hypothetical protein